MKKGCRVAAMAVCVFSAFLAMPLSASAQYNNSGVNQSTGQMNNVVDKANPISTAVPFLTLSPDAVSSGMGDQGVATRPDIYSQHYNAAKYAFWEKDYGVALTYSPWLVNLVPDMSFAYLTGLYKITDRDVIAASLAYFSMGKITFADKQGNKFEPHHPNEFSIDVSYARKLIEELSISVTGRFIYSNLTLGQNVGGVETKPGLAGAVDIGLYYSQYFDLPDFQGGRLSAGLSFTNIGNKLSYARSYDEGMNKNFLPAMLRLGVGFDWDIDYFNALGLYVEAAKLMVPTSPLYDSAGHIAAGRSEDVNVMKGLFQSFADAPGGSLEEFREVTWSVGMEYAWNKMLRIRAGYFWEDVRKGARQYVSVGVGFQYKMVGLDFSYLIPTRSFGMVNPLTNTLRIGLKFALNKKSQALLDIEEDD